jgi:glycogen(starch) synthase
MTADTVGGVWTYALELVDALAAHDVHVVLATMGAPQRPDQRRAAAASRAVEVHDGGFRLEWMDDPWDDVAAAGEWLLALSDRVRPDVVHLNEYAHAALPWGVPTVVVAHSCVLSWWRAVKGTDAPSSWDRYRGAVSGGVAAAKAVVAPTRSMARVVDRLHAPPAPCRVIPNGRRGPRATAAKADVVAATGRFWDEAKNVAALARVAGGLPWPLLLAGDLPVSAEGPVALGRLTAPEVEALLARASIFAAPARYEPFGLGILEAALAGCALVLGDIPSLRENWEGAAVFVDPDDDDDVATGIRRLIDDQPRREEIAERGRRRAAVFTPDRMAGAYAGLYEDLRDETRRPAGREAPCGS